MPRTVIGLDIGDFSVKAAVLHASGKKGWGVTDFFARPL